MTELEKLEMASDAAGRDRVFDFARANGWGNARPPVCVWWGLMRELKKEQQSN
jgi:hypothetical protein